MTWDQAWWASQPASVQALNQLSLNPLSVRADAAMALIQSSDPKNPVLIDLNIVVWGWSPYLVHLLRTNFGIPYEGNFSGTGQAPIGAGSPMNVPQPWAKAPAGTLPTVPITGDPATDLDRLNALYPPPLPPPPPPPLSTNVVGSLEYGDIYSYGPGSKDASGKWAVKDGQIVLQNGQGFTAHLSTGMFGDTLYFTLK